MFIVAAAQSGQKKLLLALHGVEFAADKYDGGGVFCHGHVLMMRDELVFDAGVGHNDKLPGLAVFARRCEHGRVQNGLQISVSGGLVGIFPHAPARIERKSIDISACLLIQQI